MKLQETPIAPPAHSLHHASTSGLGTTLLASSSNSWIIDSGESAHMSGAHSLLSHLSKLLQPSSYCIVYGRACPIVGHGEVNPTSSLQLSQNLYVPNFPVNLLSINTITKKLFCSISFLPYHYTFQNFRQGRGLVWA